MTRAERYAQIKPLREQGLMWREIAERFGISISLAHDVYSDPSGEKLAQRRRKAEREHRATCAECGGDCGDGSGWRAVQHCAECQRARLERRTHARAQIIADLWADGMVAREIADEFGWTTTRLSVEMARIRKRWPELLPHRRTPEQVQRIRDGWARARVAA